MVNESLRDYFQLSSPYTDPFRGAMFNVLEKPLSSFLCLPTLNNIYNSLRDAKVENKNTDFVSMGLDLLGVKADIIDDVYKNIPKSGPVVIVANHPFGVVEGMVLIKMVKAVRPDVKIMGNFLLGLIPEMREHLLSVDPFGRPESKSGNIKGIKKTVKWIKDGGAMIVFPAGEVSSLKLKDRKVEDPVWSKTIGGIIKRTGAAVVPVFFCGRNSAVFQALGILHPRLRTILIPRENLKNKKGVVEYAVGGKITHERISQFSTNEELVEYLRFRTYILGSRFEKNKRKFVPVFKRKMVTLENANSNIEIIKELSKLSDDAVLAENNEFRVYEMVGNECPNVLYEIGRLREKTFRIVGEGTGQSIDLDEFDNFFVHLVLWSKEKNEIAGAYRVGRADELIATRGLDGVYSHSFFNFKKDFFDHITPSLELGRSFIRMKYQKNYGSLLMLWKGIAGYVVKNPKYRYLFGCVSISNDYKVLSREYIVQNLMSEKAAENLKDYISPDRPLKFKKIVNWQKKISSDSLARIEDLESVVQDIENGIGIPVLLRHYLKVGGKLAGFNVDHDFGDALDGLIVVDLLETSERSLFKFMGKENAKQFLAYHKK